MNAPAAIFQAGKAVVEDYTDRSAWLAGRRLAHRVGGSDVPRILGASPYGGPWAVWADHHHPEYRDEVESPYLQAGLDDEPLALAMYTGIRNAADVQHAPWRICRHASIPWVVCSPDALVGTAGGVEIKHFDHPDWTEWAPSGTVWESGPYPCRTDVAQQALWCMLATGRLWWDVAAALPSGRRYPEVRVYRLWRNEDVLLDMFERIAGWRERHLVHAVEPPYDTPEEHYAVVQRRHPRPTSATVLKATPEVDALLASYGAAKVQADAAEATRDELRARLAELIGDAKGIAGPSGRASWGAPRATRSCSLKAIESQAPDLLAELVKRQIVKEGLSARPFLFTPPKLAKTEEAS